MESSLSISAAPHRMWYLDGDVVKVRLALSCVPDAATDTKKDVMPLPAVPCKNYFSVETSETESHETDVRVQVLEAEMVGVAELDASVLKVITWPGATSSARPQPSSRPGSANSKVLYTLYNTGRKPLLTEFCMRRYDCTALEFVFRLPDGCPPTFAGKGVDYRHLVAITATWQNARSGAGKVVRPRTCKAYIPLLVFNSVASVAQLPLLSLFPVPADSALAKEDFHFSVISLPSVPTPSIAGPLQDVLLPQEEQLRTSFTVRRSAKSSMQNLMAAQLQPFSLLIPCNGVNVVQVRLRSSCVALGSFLYGSFTVCDDSDEDGDVAGADPSRRRGNLDTPVPVSVTASLELLECVTPEWALTTPELSLRDTKAQGIDNVACLHKRVIAHAHFSLLDTPSVPFEFSFPIGFVPATTVTDVTTFLWQLRVAVTAVSRESLVKTSSPGVDKLGPLLEPIAAIFPLLIVPPTIPAKSRQGPRCVER